MHHGITKFRWRTKQLSCAILSPASNWDTVLPMVDSSTTSKTFMVCADVLHGVNNSTRRISWTCKLSRVQIGEDINILLFNARECLSSMLLEATKLVHGLTDFPRVER